jgi:hypothetical protein
MILTDQMSPPVKAIHKVCKPYGKQGKKPAWRVRSFRPIYYSKPFLSLQQLSTKKPEPPKRPPENESKTGSKTV